MGLQKYCEIIIVLAKICAHCLYEGARARNGISATKRHGAKSLNLMYRHNLTL